MSLIRLLRHTALTVIALTACATSWAQSFELAPLPYPYNALAPVIDEQTMPRPSWPARASPPRKSPPAWPP